MFARVKGLGVILLVSATIGCGGSSGGSVTSVPGSTKLMTLTPTQKTQLCNDIISYDTKNVSQADLCKLQGIVAALIGVSVEPTISDAELQTLCMQTVTDCNAAPVEPGTCPIGDTSTCSADATISDVTKCITDDTAALNSILAMFPSCSGVTQAWLAANANSVGGGPAVPASCTSLIAKCPDIMATTTQ